MLHAATAFLSLSSASSFVPPNPINPSRSTNIRPITNLHRLQLVTDQPSSLRANSGFSAFKSPADRSIFPKHYSRLDIACKATKKNNDPASNCPLDELDQQFCDIPGAEKSKKRLGFIDKTRHKMVDNTLKREVYAGFETTEFTLENVLALRNRDCRKELSKIPAGISISSVAIGDIQAEWLTPTNTKNLLPKVGLYFFGGAYLIGTPACHRAITGNLARMANMKILSSDYRKLPENSYPAALQDAVSAFDYLISEGYKSEDIVIMGDSSGGHLALSLALKLKEQHPNQTLGGLVLISPWTDMTMTSETIASKSKTDPILPAHRMPELVDRFAGNMKRNDPRISPLHADLKGLPPMLIHVGENEILLGDSTSLAAKAHAANVHTEAKVWADMPHVFHILHDYLPESKQALEEVAQFIKRRV